MAVFYEGTTREMHVGDAVVGRGVCDGTRLDGRRGTIVSVGLSFSGYVANVDFGSFRWSVYKNNIIPADVAENMPKICTVCGKAITRDMKLGARLFKYEYLCDDCVDTHIAKVHGYHYGKDLSYVYAKDNITLGAEIELDDPDEHGSKTQVVRDVVDYARKKGYSLIMHHERDGSLNGAGFESVTAPLTLREWRSDEVIGQLNALMSSAEENGFDVWGDSYNKAGLHVHIGRKDLCGTDKNKSDAVGLLMGWAVTRLWDKGFKELSRRNDIGYCSTFGAGNGGLFDTNAVYDRYYAVNIENKNTIELRIFAGARDVDDILVAVDMCYMLAKWAVKKINAFSKRGTYSAKAGKYDDCLEYADRLTWSALVKYSKFPEVTLKAMRDAGIVF